MSYDFGELDELVPAYAMSIHKSQGGEFPAVVIPVHTQHYLMLQRNLLYTGITRGRKLVVVVGTPRAVAIAVKRGEAQHRHSALRGRLANGEAPDCNMSRLTFWRSALCSVAQLRASTPLSPM